jgi:hypothetical protein
LRRLCRAGCDREVFHSDTIALLHEAASGSRRDRSHRHGPPPPPLVANARSSTATSSLACSSTTRLPRDTHRSGSLMPIILMTPIAPALRCPSKSRRSRATAKPRGNTMPIAAFRKLYGVEETARDMDHEARTVVRQRESRPRLRLAPALVRGVPSESRRTVRLHRWAQLCATSSITAMRSGIYGRRHRVLSRKALGCLTGPALECPMKTRRLRKACNLG